MATLNTVECSLEASGSCSYQLLIELPQVRVAVPADLIQEWGVASECPEPARNPVFAAVSLVRAVNASVHL